MASSCRPDAPRRRALLSAGLVAVLSGVGCVSQTTPETEEQAKASPVLQREIDQRVGSLRYLHDKQLFSSMQRLIYLGESAIPALVAALTDDDPKTRACSAYVLGEIGDTSVVPQVHPLLEDPVETVRLEGASSLIALGDWSAIPVLIGALRHTEPAVRYKAIKILAASVKQDFGYAYDAPELEREKAIARWEEWWKKAKAQHLL